MDGQDLEVFSLIGKFRIKTNERRQALVRAGTTPVSPEFDNHPPAFERFKSQVLVGILGTRKQRGGGTLPTSFPTGDGLSSSVPISREVHSSRRLTVCRTVSEFLDDSLNSYSPSGRTNVKLTIPPSFIPMRWRRPGKGMMAIRFSDGEL